MRAPAQGRLGLEEHKFRHGHHQVTNSTGKSEGVGRGVTSTGNKLRHKQEHSEQRHKWEYKLYNLMDRLKQGRRRT